MTRVKPPEAFIKNWGKKLFKIFKLEDAELNQQICSTCLYNLLMPGSFMFFYVSNMLPISNLLSLKETFLVGFFGCFFYLDLIL